MLTLLPVLLPLVGGAAVFPLQNRKRREFLSVAVTLLTAGSAILLSLRRGDAVTLLRLSGTLSLSLRADGLSAVFLPLITVIWFFVLLYAFDYTAEDAHPSRFFGFYLWTLSALLGLSLAANLETAYMFFEMMTLVSMPLVLQDGLLRSREAALQYLGFSALGATLALLGFFLLAPYASGTAFTAGGVSFAAGHEKALTAAFFLLALGFGAKAGLVPLQAWLPVAHPVAPAPASAVLSGLVTKGGVLAVLRVTLYLFGADFVRGTWAQTVLLTLALLTVFLGSMLALRETVLKKRLAYSSVSNVSYVLFGLFLLEPDALTGAFLQIVFHAFAKCALFLAAGAMIHACHADTVSAFPGIGKRMPLTLSAFAFASLSLVGIPPLGGFAAKWYLALGALQGGGTLGLVGVAVLLISALLTAFYLFPLVTRGFFPGDEPSADGAEAGGRMCAAMLVFAAATLLFGAYPAPLIRYFTSLASTLL